MDSMLRVWTPKKKVFHVFAMLKLQLKLLKGIEVHGLVKPATIKQLRFTFLYGQLTLQALPM